MLTPAGEVKVADFGLARLAGDTQATDLTQIGMTMGTPLYMSPEQVEGKPLDCRSDLYSFGVTCYHMLAGNPPFLGETALGVAVQHLKREPAVAGDAAARSARRPCAASFTRCSSRTRRAAGNRRASCSASFATCSSNTAPTRRRGFRRLGIVGRPAGRPAAGGQPATGQRDEQRRGRDGRRGGGGCWRSGWWRCLPPAALRPGSPCGRSRCWTSRGPDTCGFPARKPPWPSILRQPDRHRRGLAERAGIFPREGIRRPPRQAAIGPHLPPAQLRPGDGDFRRAGRLDRRRQGVSGLGAGGQDRRAYAPGEIRASRPRCSTSYGRSAASCATSR